MDVELCVDTCAADAECLATERCRLISPNDAPGAPFRFADEEVAEQGRGLGLCDPFWDHPGVVSATPLPVEDWEEDYGFDPSEIPADPDPDMTAE